jgi:Flp pilus assembly protein TadG
MVIGGIVRTASARAARALRSLLLDRSGVAAVEFALLLPVMIMLYVGGIEVSNGFTIKRKVINATSALADLVTRTEEIGSTEMENILEAATAVITPYDAANMRIKLMGVSIDPDGAATVAWGAVKDDTCPIEGATVDLPDGVAIADSFLIVAEVHYSFKPVIGYTIIGTRDIAEIFYLKPRLSGTIPYDGECVSTGPSL